MAKTVKFEEKMRRLSEIVEKLESNSIDIDSALKLYEEGLNLSKELETQLKGYEEKINKLSKEK